MDTEKVNIAVETWNRETGEMEGRKIVDHNARQDRQWMGKHCFWAFRTGREIRTYPVN